MSQFTVEERHRRSYSPPGLMVLRGPKEDYKQGSHWVVGNDYGYAEVRLMKKGDSYYPESFYIEHIFIKEELRGKGFGRELYLLVEEMARKLGSQWIQIDSELEAVGFWDKMGYTKLDKVYYKDKTAMVKRLEP